MNIKFKTPLKNRVTLARFEGSIIAELLENGNEVFVPLKNGRQLWLHSSATFNNIQILETKPKNNCFLVETSKNYLPQIENGYDIENYKIVDFIYNKTTVFPDNKNSVVFKEFEDETYLFLIHNEIKKWISFDILIPHDNLKIRGILSCDFDKKVDSLENFFKILNGIEFFSDKIKNRKDEDFLEELVDYKPKVNQLQILKIQQDKDISLDNLTKLLNNLSKEKIHLFDIFFKFVHKKIKTSVKDDTLTISYGRTGKWNREKESFNVKYDLNSLKFETDSVSQRAYLFKYLEKPDYIHIKNAIEKIYGIDLFPNITAEIEKNNNEFNKLFVD